MRQASARGVFVLRTVNNVTALLAVGLIHIQIYHVLLQIWVTDQFQMKLSDSCAALADDRIEETKSIEQGKIRSLHTGTQGETLFPHG